MAGAQAAGFFGGALKGIGRVKANIDESRALTKQSGMLRINAFALSKTKQRALNLFDRDVRDLESQQVSSYAKSGVDISSGSALAVVAQDRVSAFGDREAIREDYDNRIDNVMFEADQASQRARQLRDPLQNNLTFFSSLFGG